MLKRNEKGREMSNESFKPEGRVRLLFSDNAKRALVDPIPKMSCEEAGKETASFRQGTLDPGGMILLIHHHKSSNHDPGCPAVKESGLVEELRKALQDYRDGK